MARGRPSKKQLILDTARTLFAQTGYQGTSIDLVVKQAGVSKPTVYNNFSTKQALLLALIEALLDELETDCQTLWKQADLSPAEAIVAVFEHIVNTPAFLAVYRICYGESHKLEPQTYELIKQFDRLVQSGYRQWLINNNVQQSDGCFLSVIAICREGILIPELSKTARVDRKLIINAIETQLN